MSLESAIHQLQQEALNELSTCQNIDQLHNIRRKFIGRSGKIREIFAEIEKIQEREEKAKFGSLANAVRRQIEEEIKKLLTKLQQAKPKEIQFDVTLPGKFHKYGYAHPVYATMKEIQNIFESLGFSVVYGPEIDNEYNNFEALNIPKDHPAHDVFATFYITDRMLLRSHTSPVQIRAMLSMKPPLRIIAPGKVFRPDTPDASHLPIFHQVEGLAVDRHITFAHLKGVLELFTKRMFGEDVRMRFRPSYFPFVEPGAEVDISCVVCQGRGCAVCKNSGWLEILGCGMVHPKVFENVGYDPEEWIGFAFGMGVERIAMLKYGINDIRLFVENLSSFLHQF